MEHIRQFDWCKFEYDPHPENFLGEKELDNSVTERILRGTFKNPFLSSEESDDEPLSINWDKILNQQKNVKSTSLYVPGLKPVPKYLKISSLTFKQHFIILRVIAAENKTVLQEYKFQEPGNKGKKLAKGLKEIYEKEQQEFLQWAKTVWNMGDNIKALKTMPIIEEVYESLYKVQTHQLSSLQRNYQMASLIELKYDNTSGCALTVEKDLDHVNTSELPEITSPVMNKKYTLYVNKPHLPKICTKHPSKFILPNENGVTDLPLNEVYEELSHYAAQHNVPCIMSEEAATRMLEHDRYWNLPLFVRTQVCADGQKRNIVVIGKEIIYNKQPARYRSYNAIQYLMHLQFCLKSLNKTKTNLVHKPIKKYASTSNEGNKKPELIVPTKQESSSDEDDGLIIEFDDMGVEDSQEQPMEEDSPLPSKRPRLEEVEISPPPQKSTPDLNLGGMLTCTCKDSFELPKRSYRKWRLSNENSTSKGQDIIIHCEHKCQLNGQEYILESIPEYQLELGGTLQSESKLRSLALSLHLRTNAKLMNVRVDTLTGDIVTIDHLSLSDLSPDGAYQQDAAQVLLGAVNQLMGLLPGDYLLVHEPKHGANVMLFVSRRTPTDNGITISANNTQISDEDELNELLTPPNLGPVFLPFHKYRKILPLAFCHNISHVAKPKPQKKPPPPKNKKRNRRKKSN